MSGARPARKLSQSAERARVRTLARRKSQAAREFKRRGGIFGAVCRFLFEIPGA